MNRTDYTTSSGRIRALEKRMLSSATIERLIGITSLEEVLRLLSAETEYDFSRLATPHDYEQVIQPSVRDLYKRGKELSQHDELVEIVFCKYDFHNLKVAFKAEHYPQRTENPYATVTDIVPIELAKLAAGDPDVKSLPAHLRDAAVLLREALERSGVNPQTIDIVLDKAMFAFMKESAETLGLPIVLSYVELLIDCYNLRTLLRARGMSKGRTFLKDALAPGGQMDLSTFERQYDADVTALTTALSKTRLGKAVQGGMAAFAQSDNYSQMERLLDNMLVEHLKSVKYMAYGPELVFAYLINKENEIRQMRIILACKENHIRPEALRERLRDNYV